MSNQHGNNLNDVQHSVVRTIRKLSSGSNPPINAMVQSGILCVLADGLQKHKHPEVQCEASSAIIDITFNPFGHMKAIIDCGIVQLLLDLLESPILEVRSNAITALGNIIGEGPEIRTLVIDLEVIPRLINLIKEDVPLPLLQGISWTIVNICRDTKPMISESVVQELLPAICKLIYHPDPDIITNVAYAIAYLASGKVEWIPLLIHSGVTFSLAPLLKRQEVSILKAVLRAIGNIIHRDHKQIQVLINCNMLSYFPGLLLHKIQDIEIEATKVLRTMIAEDQKLIELSINDLNTLLIYLQKYDYIKNSDINNMNNFNYNDTQTEITHLLIQGIIPSLCESLTGKNEYLLKNSLEKIDMILKFSGSQFPFAYSQLDQHGGLNKIQNLQLHFNSAIYRQAYDILERCCSKQ